MDDPPITRSVLCVLQEADLTEYTLLLNDKLHVSQVDHLKYVRDGDLAELGMTKPEIRRLWKHYHKHRPHGLVGRLRKAVFTRSASIDKTPSLHSTPSISSAADTSSHIIAASSVTLCKQLGKGEFGAVWQAVWTRGESRVQVAVKCVLPDKMQSSIGDFIREAAIMHQINHKHIVHMYGVVLETKTVMLVSELAALRSLLECVRDCKLRATFNITRLCTYAEQIADGMAYLEEGKMIHRDLAARNILVFDADLVKISDFGLSRSLGSGEDYYRSEFNPTMKLPIAWCAPECIKLLKFTSASDVWAFAVTLWEMLTEGLQPWQGMKGDQILSTIDKPACLRLDEPDVCPADFYALMCRCWAHEPTDRPNFKEILTELCDLRPERLRTICACLDGEKDHLQYDDGELLVIISKTPPTYPDGYFWLAVNSQGRCGLLLPSNTVAHVGVDYPKLPSNFAVLRSKGTPITSPKKLMNGKKLADNKHLISNPTNLQHIEHFGLDGTHSGQPTEGSIDHSSRVPSSLDDRSMCSKTPTPVPHRKPGKPSPPLPSSAKPPRSTPIMGKRRLIKPRPEISSPIVGSVRRSNENLALVDVERPTTLFDSDNNSWTPRGSFAELPPPGTDAPSSPLIGVVARQTPSTPAPTPASSLFDEVFSALNADSVKLTGFAHATDAFVHSNHMQCRTVSPIMSRRQSSFDDGMDDGDDRQALIEGGSGDVVVRSQMTSPSSVHVKHMSLADARLVDGLTVEAKRMSDRYFTKYSAERQRRTDLDSGLRSVNDRRSTSSSTSSLDSLGGTMGASESKTKHRSLSKHAAFRERMKALGQMSRNGVVDQPDLTKGPKSSFSEKLPPERSQTWTPEAEDAYKLLIECGRDIQAVASAATSPVSKPSPSSIATTGSCASSASIPEKHAAVIRRSSARFRMAGVSEDSCEMNPMRLVSIGARLGSMPPPVPPKPRRQAQLPQQQLPQAHHLQRSNGNNDGGAPMASIETVDKYELLDYVMQGLEVGK